MSAAWEKATGVGVGAHLARLYQEALARCRLLFVATPRATDLATWGAGAALESDAVMVIDLSTLASGQVRAISHGLPAEADLRSPTQLGALRTALRQIQLLCIHGLDDAYAHAPRETLDWLEWWGHNVLLTMVSSADPGRWALLPALAGLSLGVDRVDDQAHSVAARSETIDLISRLLETKP